MTLVHQTFRYELKPNKKQIDSFIKACGVARFAWNWGLSRRIELYNTKEGKERLTNARKQHKELVMLKKTELHWMYDVSKNVPQYALRNLDHAYENYYYALKHSAVANRPKYKRKGEYDKFYLQQAKQSMKVLHNVIQLPRIGKVKTKEGTFKFRGKILGATISREADRWFCSVYVYVDRHVSQPATDEIVGIDLGLMNFAVVSNGIDYDYRQAPKPLNGKLSRYKRLCRWLSRTINGSNNHEKAKLRLSRIYRHIKNERKDFINKLTTELAKTKSVIVIEDLDVKSMMGNHRLARSIGDVSWGEFKRQLVYKTKWYGSRLIIAPRFEPTSKMCSKCGAINKSLVLSNRIWICGNCGVTHDRDENAADNIRNYGIKLLNTESFSGIHACGESVSPQRGQFSMKQEVSRSISLSNGGFYNGNT